MYTAFSHILEDFSKFRVICEQEIIVPKVYYYLVT